MEEITMDDAITCVTEADTFLATTKVKPMGSESRKYTQQELKKIGEELDKALERPMPENFFESNRENVLESSISKEGERKMEEDAKTLESKDALETVRGAHYAKDMLEEIRVWKKNVQALYDLAGLLYILKYENMCNNISGAALFFRVLNNLQDPKITVGYSGESLVDKSCSLSKQMDQIRERYSEIIPDIDSYLKDVTAINIDEYLFNSCITDGTGNIIRWYDKPYNLVGSLIESHSIKWLKELLSSNIGSGYRFWMLDDIIKSNKVWLKELVDDNNYPDSVYHAFYDHETNEENKKKSNDRINDLIKSWAEQRTIDNKYEMVRDMRVDNLDFLQKSGMIDFVKDVTYCSNYGTLAVPAQIYARKDGIYYFGSFYDTESYKSFNGIRQNTDKYLIHNIVRTGEELDRLIQLKNFKLTDENVQEIISALSCCDKVYEWELKKIYEAIEKKATTPKEYRKVKQIIKQIQDALDPEKLKEGRQALVTRLFNMGDSLNAQVPGKMKIKDIQFQVK